MCKRISCLFRRMPDLYFGRSTPHGISFVCISHRSYHYDNGFLYDLLYIALNELRLVSCKHPCQTIIAKPQSRDTLSERPTRPDPDLPHRLAALHPRTHTLDPPEY